MRRSVSIKSSVQVSNQKKLHNCLNYIDENDSNVLMPLVNSSINFMMVSSCLTTFLFLALTLPPPDSCSMVTSPLEWL